MDGLGEGGKVGVVLLGVCAGELADGAIEGVGVAEVGGDGDGVTGPGVGMGQCASAHGGVLEQSVGGHRSDVG